MKISIITATWNSAETVRDTFESILKQNYKNYEYIIIDGCSKDQTINIIREYEHRFQGRMRWVSEPDEGIYDAMNKGIAMATGEVVGLLNSDDYYFSNDVLSTIADCFDEYPDIEAVYGDVRYVSWNDVSHLVRKYSSKLFRRFWMHAGFMPAHPTFYCRKSTYERFKLDGNQITNFRGDKDKAYFNTTYKIAADFECLLRMIFVGHIRTHYIEKTFVTMRSGGASSSGISSHKIILADHRRAFRENHVYTNSLLILFRYLYKILMLIKDRMICKYSS